MSKRAKIAIATGDPAGIGPEISLKAALDPAVRNACRPIVVSDLGVIERHARACGLEPAIRAIRRVGDADWSNDCVNVLDCAQPDLAALDFGTTAAASGRASLAFADMAIKAALAGEVDAVVAAPQNETSIARAGIAFDGYPSFVARVTGTDEDNVYLMLCFGDTKIVHTTLHRSVRDAIAMITREKVIGVISAAERTLTLMGTTAPKIAVGGLNPHAGEGGALGREEIDIIEPAAKELNDEGLPIQGPFPADTIFLKARDGLLDSIVTMYHDQGQVAVKLMGFERGVTVAGGLPTPITTPAHGTAFDITGQGKANAEAMTQALLLAAKMGATRLT